MVSNIFCLYLYSFFFLGGGAVGGGYTSSCVAAASCDCGKIHKNTQEYDEVWNPEILNAKYDLT